MHRHLHPSRLNSSDRTINSWRYFRVLLLLVIALNSNYAIAQSLEETRHLQMDQIDSLKKTLPPLADSARVDALNKISSMYCKLWDYDLDYRQTDSARLYAEQAGREARLINYVLGQAISFDNLGKIECERGYFKKGEPYFLQAIQLAKKSNLLNELNSAYFHLAWSLGVQGKDDGSPERVQMALDYFRSVLDEKNESYAFDMMAGYYQGKGYYLKAFEYSQKEFLKFNRPYDTYGNLYSPEKMRGLFLIAGDTTKALIYFQQSVNSAKAKGLGYHSNITDIYQIYFMKKQYDSALHVLEQYHRLLEAYDDDVTMQKRWLMFNAVDLARTDNALGNYDKTISMLPEALEFFAQGRDMDQVMNVLLLITQAYDAKKDNAKALYYGRQLIDHAERIGTAHFMMDGYGLLWRVFDRQHNIAQAYRYYLKYIELKNALDTELQLCKIAAANWIEKNAQHQAQIDDLDKDNRIKQQALQSESLMKKIYAGSLVAFALLGAILFRNLSLKRKNEKLQNEKNQSVLRNQATELEMQALRAQMNPHFIFNSLNSINRFILQNNKAQASEYLTKFSKLIRLILQNSQAALIPMESELESLELYLDLEAVRFNHHFEYRISVSKNLDVTAVLVPPLMIQPYAENAIWHGLMHKEEKGQLDIEVGLENDLLLLRIRDDGIGRKQASMLASKSATRNKSMGLKITADRLAILQSESNHSSATINDLVHADGGAAGTEVIIKIPAVYD